MVLFTASYRACATRLAAALSALTLSAALCAVSAFAAPAVDSALSPASPQATLTQVEALAASLRSSGFSAPESDPWYAPYLAEAARRSIPLQSLTAPVSTQEAVTFLVQTHSAALSSRGIAGFMQDFALSPESAQLTRAQFRTLLSSFLTRKERVCAPLLKEVATLPSNAFSGITLTYPLPRLLFETEYRVITGTASQSTATIVTQSPDGTQQTVTAPSPFRFPLTLPPGTHKVGILSGTAGTATAYALRVAPRDCLPLPAASLLPAPTLAHSITGTRAALSFASTSPFTAVHLTLSQGTTTAEYFLTGSASFQPPLADFTSFQPGTAHITVSGITTTGTLAQLTAETAPATTQLPLIYHEYADDRPDQATCSPLPSAHTGTPFTITCTPLTPLSPTAYLTYGDSIPTPLPITPTSPSLTITPKKGETVIVEVNNTSGLAVLNRPIYPSGSLPLIPRLGDTADRDALLSDTFFSARERTTLARSILRTRAAHSLPRLTRDKRLDALAQSYAERMAKEGFFGHSDPQGADAEDRRLAAHYPYPLAENLALEASAALAHSGLMRSGGHRSAILGAEWQHFGVGAAAGQSGRYYVQYFSTGARSQSTLRTLFDAQLTSSRAALSLPSLTQNTSVQSVLQSFVEAHALEDPAFAYGTDTLESRIRTTSFKDSFSAVLIEAGTIADALAQLRDTAPELFTSVKASFTYGITQNATGLYRIIGIY